MRAKRKINTLLFIGFFLLGGFVHSVEPEDRFWSTVMNFAEFMIYAGLILSWLQSVDRRLPPTRAKTYLLAAGCLMLLFLASQYTKYRIAVSPGLTRACWYLYYVPMLLIPTLFLMTCFRFFRGSESGKPGELWFLLPALLLALGVATNDLRTLVFRPIGELADMTGADDTYTHGVLFYAAYAWAGIALAAGLFFLAAAGKKSGRWKKVLQPLGLLICTPPMIVLFKRFPDDPFPISYGWPQMLMFLMLAAFESCIRSRLIPSNENYPGFFAHLDYPVLITDRELKQAFQTRSPIRATEEELREALKGPVCPRPDKRLLSMELRAGYAFREEDLSAVNRLNEELRDANEVLRLENEILERERELTAEQAGIEERSRLYRKAALEIYPVQKKIAGILERARPGEPSFREDIEQALALTAYVKRKANFVLMEAERESISAKELASALEESCHYLQYCGMHAAASVPARRDFPCREAMAVYDCFEAAAEALLGKTEEFFVRLQDDELLVMADCGELPKLSALALPARQSYAEGQMVLRAALGGEAP